MIIKLLTEHHLEFLRLKGGCRGSSESTPVKMSYCWKSQAAAHIIGDGILLSWTGPCGHVVAPKSFYHGILQIYKISL